MAARSGATLALVLVLAGVAAAEEARVTDGDTLTLGAVQVRLFGVDAPEFRQRCPAGERRRLGLRRGRGGAPHRARGGGAGALRAAGRRQLRTPRLGLHGGGRRSRRRSGGRGPGARLPALQRRIRGGRGGGARRPAAGSGRVPQRPLGTIGPRPRKASCRPRAGRPTAARSRATSARAGRGSTIAPASPPTRGPGSTRDAARPGSATRRRRGRPASDPPAPSSRRGAAQALRRMPKNPSAPMPAAISPKPAGSGTGAGLVCL